MCAYPYGKTCEVFHFYISTLVTILLYLFHYKPQIIDYIIGRLFIPKSIFFINKHFSSVGNCKQYKHCNILPCNFPYKVIHGFIVSALSYAKWNYSYTNMIAFIKLRLYWLKVEQVTIRVNLLFITFAQNIPHSRSCIKYFSIIKYFKIVYFNNNM